MACLQPVAFLRLDPAFRRPEQVFAVPAARQGTPELRGLVPAYRVPYYEQWLELFRKADLHIHLQQAAVQAARPSYRQTAGEVAFIHLIGKLMKQRRPEEGTAPTGSAASPVAKGWEMF